MRSPSLGPAFVATVFLLFTEACDRPYLITSEPDGGGGGAGGFTIPPGGAPGGPGGAGGGAGGARSDARVDPAPGSRDGPAPVGTPDAPAREVAVGSPPDSGPDRPADTATDAVVMVRACEQINCPDLLQLTAACTSHDSVCTSEEVSSTLSNYCYENDVRKQSTRVYSGSDDGAFVTTMAVKKPDGSDCYTLVMTGSSEDEVEGWAFQRPGGQEVARGEWNKEEDVLTLICGGVRYVLGDIGCPGTDGEPEPGQCDEGDCELP